MSGLFCDEPSEIYRSKFDGFILEVYEDGTVCLLNLCNMTSAVIESDRLVELGNVILHCAANSSELPDMTDELPF
jgi:hypothetical protein